MPGALSSGPVQGKAASDLSFLSRHSRSTEASTRMHQDPEGAPGWGAGHTLSPHCPLCTLDPQLHPGEAQSEGSLG